jgi:hypothetical protein
VAERVKAHIYKVPSYAPYPWVYEVDHLGPDGRRDTSVDSLDYGSLESFGAALEASCQVMRATA